jgi:UDP-N-acetylmuramoyl-tripeptide--D-alanyl-D-alanine ligase
MVCELGEGEPGALARYVDLSRPHVAIVTSVGRAHVGELGGIDAVRQEFVDAIAAMRSGSTPVLPEGDAWLHTPCAVHFGVERAWHEGGAARFELADGSAWRLPVPGLHNASNAAAVIAATRELGLDDATIGRGLASFQPAEMRLAVREIAGATVIVDCYNANPDSMAAALRTLAEVGRGKRTVAVLGDMLELGPDSRAWHQELGGLAASMADECVFIGPNSRAGFEAAGRGAWFATVAQAVDPIAELARPGSVLLLKASRGMALEGLLAGLDRSAVA